MKLQQLINAKEVLDKLANAKGMKASCSYKIFKNYSKIENEFNSYDKARVKTLEEHCLKNEQGEPVIEDNMYKFTNEELAHVNEELNTLVNNEVELELNKIKLEDIENVELTPLEIGVIEFLLEE